MVASLTFRARGHPPVPIAYAVDHVAVNRNRLPKPRGRLRGAYRAPLETMLGEHYWEKRDDSVSPDNALVLAGIALLLG